MSCRCDGASRSTTDESDDGLKASEVGWGARSSPAHFESKEFWNEKLLNELTARRSTNSPVTGSPTRTQLNVLFTLNVHKNDSSSQSDRDNCKRGRKFVSIYNDSWKTLNRRVAEI